MGTFDKEPRRTSRKPWGTALAVAGALFGGAGDAGAQNRSPYADWGLTPEVEQRCIAQDRIEREKMARNEAPNMGNVCGGDEELERQSRTFFQNFFQRRDATESPADRAQREAQDAKMQKEEDELFRYCESVNFAGERCRGM